MFRRYYPCEHVMCYECSQPEKGYCYICEEKIGGLDCYQMVGISYWNKEDGKKLPPPAPMVVPQSQVPINTATAQVPVEVKMEGNIVKSPIARTALLLNRVANFPSSRIATARTAGRLMACRIVAYGCIGVNSISKPNSSIAIQLRKRKISKRHTNTSFHIKF